MNAQQSGLLTQNMTPEQARLLDQQLRQKQFQGKNYGGGALGGFLTSASGAIQGAAGAGQGLAERFGAERQVGANEGAAVARQGAVAEQKQAGLEAITQAVSASKLTDEEKTIVVKMVSTGQMTASQAMARLDSASGRTTEAEQTELTNKLSNKTPEQLKTIQRNAIAAGNTKLATAANSMLGTMKPIASAVESAKLQKDFTNVGEWLKSGGTTPLTPRTKKAENSYVVMHIATGTDNNGQPIMKSVLVDKKKIAAESANASVIDISTLDGTSLLDVDDAAVLSEDVSKEDQKIVTSLGGIKGMTVIQSQELRTDVENMANTAILLGQRINNPMASSVLGLTKLPNRAIQEAAETEEGVLSSYLGRFSIKEAIAAAKLLGVNPTDKDFEKSMQAKPQVSDGVAVWKDWYINEYVVDMKTFVSSKYDGSNERKKQIVHMLDTLAKETMKPAKQKAATTASGTKYTIL